MISSSFRLPLLVLAVLLGSVVAGTAALVGFSDEAQVAAPDWIWCDSEAAPGAACSVRTQFSLWSSADGADLHIAASGPAKVLLDGKPAGATTGKGQATVLRLGPLTAGPHDLQIDATHAEGRPGICAYLDLPSGCADRLRVGTGAGWNLAAPSANGTGNDAKVLAGYEAGPAPYAFGPPPTVIAVPKGPRFWTVLGVLAASLAACCLAGPVLRPAAAPRRDTAVANLAIIGPSIAYGTASVAIAALGATSASVGAIVALQLVATTLFTLVLIGWKSGTQRIDQDQVQHRAELRGYDDMCHEVDMLVLEVNQCPDDLRAALDQPIRELADGIRYAATTTETPELDRRILDGIGALRQAVRGGQATAGAADIQPGIRMLLGAIREREIRAQSARRA